jgi:hypothetical protein
VCADCGSWLGGCQSKDELSSALIDLSEEIMAQVGHAVFGFKLRFKRFDSKRGVCVMVTYVAVLPGPVC